MKYIKLFMLVAMASLFASCSDDEEYNSNSEVTVGFEQATVTMKETAGIFNIPIKVTGARNGNVSIVVTTEETGEYPAKENVNYIITDKTLNLKADTLKSGVINVEVKAINDSEVNEDRTFKLNITTVNGAQKSETTSVLVTLRDDDGEFYSRFSGEWVMTAKEVVGEDDNNNLIFADFSPIIVEINATSDETKPEYNNILTAYSKAMFDVGVKLDCAWNFRYSYNEDTNKGTFAFICGETISTYSAYQWTWATDDGYRYTFDDVTAEWSLDEEKNLPTTLKFPEGKFLYFYGGTSGSIGSWVSLTNVTLTRR